MCDDADLGGSDNHRKDTQSHEYQRAQDQASATKGTIETKSITSKE